MGSETPVVSALCFGLDNRWHVYVVPTLDRHRFENGEESVPVVQISIFSMKFSFHFFRRPFFLERVLLFPFGVDGTFYCGVNIVTTRDRYDRFW